MEYQLDCSLAKETRARLDPFTLAYVEAAMWTLTDGDRGESCDHLGLHDIADETIAAAIVACREFRELCELEGDLLAGSDDRQAGHDLWLTRNRHGAGFWDRDPATYPMDPKGKQLTALAHAAGEVDWYVGDDGMVYQ